jgi:hypothetical protein
MNMVKNKNPENTKNFAAQAVNLADLIAYQAGSVVSRTIIEKKAVTITLFAFDQK